MIDDDVFALLQKNASAFVDTPNTVLRRLLGVQHQANKHEAKAISPEEDQVEARDINMFISEIDAELTSELSKKKARTKQPKTDLATLIQTGAIQLGETVYLVDYQGNRIPGYEAKVAKRFLEREGHSYSMSDLARSLLNEVGFTSSSVRGPAHWATAKGQTLALLWDNYLSNQ